MMGETLNYTEVYSLDMFVWRASAAFQRTLPLAEESNTPVAAHRRSEVRSRRRLTRGRPARARTAFRAG